MFGRMFSAFSPGRSSGGFSVAPQPIILATAGLRIVTGLFPHANILSGAAFEVVPGVAGFILLPVMWTLEKNFTVAYAPTNAQFTLSGATVSTSLATILAPVVTSTGTRIDYGVGTGVANLGGGTVANVIGKSLVITPSAGNGGGSAANRLQYTVAYLLVKGL